MMADAYDKSVMKKKGDAYMRNYRNNMQQYMQHPPYGREECRCHEMHQRRMERMNPPSDTGCGCDKENRKKTPEWMSLAMAYVPWQEWRALYEAEKGFHCGTIFAELNKPFMGTGGCLR